MPQNYRKRRVAHGPSKNELRAARNERAEAKTLREQFPQIDRLHLDFRLEGPTGTPLDNVSKEIPLDEPLNLEILCPSTCGNGRFDLITMLENSVALQKE